MYYIEQKLTFFPIIFLNVDSSFNILDRHLKLSVGILDILMEGTVSQIFYLSPSSSLTQNKN